MADRESLIKRLVDLGYLKTESVIKAFSEVDRKAFLPLEMWDHAYEDAPLPIGEDQTISAPHMVAIMCESADLEAGNHVLEIGAGSGYNGCVISHITGNVVYSIERHEKLSSWAKKNLERAKCNKVRVLVGDGTLGHVEDAPYDRIIVTAGAPEPPEPLINQLKLGGKLLIPVGSRYSQDLLRFTKQRGGLEKENLGGCIFVPLIGKYGWAE